MLHRLKHNLFLAAIILLTADFQSLFASDNKAAGIVRGKVVDISSREPLPFASVVIKGTNAGAVTDINGEFAIVNVAPGFVQVQAYLVGYKPKLTEEVYVTNEKTPYVTIELEKAPSELTEVEITTPQFNKKEESPLSMQTLGIREIEKNPGGNRDISKVIQSLPGVASTPSFRNDIIIRGGSPAENKFFLDGIEIPVINHFQTQGSTGGPVGILNPDFIREVDFYSGSFPANRGNALSSILDFRQIDGNIEKTRFRGTIGSSDIGFTVDGPAGKQTTYIASIRRSYLQFLFSALKLPFLPTFTDMQFKVRHKFDNKNEIIVLGLGAYDEVNLNLDVNDGITDPDILERNNYILGNIPEYGQWNYTLGTQYRHYGKSSLTTITLSRNSYSNTSEKYKNNDDSDPQNQISDYESSETENKLRVEYSATRSKLRFNVGTGLETAEFTIANTSYITSSTGPTLRKYNSDISFVKYSLFGSASYPFFKNRFTVSAGFRADGNSYSDDMSNLLTQFSPRTALSYSITEKWFLNAGAGIYYQLPAYTMMGFKDQSGVLINKEMGLSYISNTQLTGGVEFRPDDKTRITYELFNKQYQDYPFSLTDSISLANLGSDFGAIGNDLITSTSVGRAYGMEFMAQRRSAEGLYGILSYTLVRSEFKEKTGDYAPSSWDSKHLLTLTAGKQLNKNWDIGIKWRFVDGRPYTPYDTAASALKSNWDVRKSGIPDYDYLNDYRLPAFHQLDIRIDKTWFFTHWSMNLYLDIQNVYNFKAENQDILNVRTDANGQPITSQTDPDRYEVYFIKDDSGTILPSIGIIIDF